MLEVVQPGHLDAGKTSVAFGGNGLEICERIVLGHTGFLVPARLCFWRPKRTETERVSSL